MQIQVNSIDQLTMSTITYWSFLTPDPTLRKLSKVLPLHYSEMIVSS